MEDLAYEPGELAKALKMSVSGLYKAARKGNLPSVRVGRRVLFPKAPIDAQFGLAPNSDQAPKAA